MSAPLTAAVAVIPTAELRGGDVTVADVTHDSRQVRPGSLFCCVPGSVHDGHDHAPAAVAAGAVALLVERWLPDPRGPGRPPHAPVPQVRVPSVRAAMGPAAAAVHGHPSERIRVVGVTGTNGKTTTCYLLESAFGAAGWGTGLIGTVETRIHGDAQPALRTTPEGTDLQRTLATMVARGVDGVAMEVSSHGLDQRRVDGTRYSVAVFTNLGRDHLDWHGTVDAYFAAKARLFTTHLSERGVVDVDDPWGRRLVARATVPVTTLGSDPAADVVVGDVVSSLDGVRATLSGRFGPVELRTRLLGHHNLRNAAGAYVAARLAGVGDAAARAGIAGCPGVPGRLERVEAGGVTVLVDYAHTPDAVSAVIESLRPLVGAAGRLHLVIGCGGDRDRDKRPAMGAAAVQADVAYLTSDNPRSEDPEAILDAMEAGARAAVTSGAPGRYRRAVDRREAIAAALDAATAGDVVVIAGKGHETGQEYADHVVPFDDRQVAAGHLAARTAP